VGGECGVGGWGEKKTRVGVSVNREVFDHRQKVLGLTEKEKKGSLKGKAIR